LRQPAVRWVRTTSEYLVIFSYFVYEIYCVLRASIVTVIVLEIWQLLYVFVILRRVKVYELSDANVYCFHVPHMTHPTEMSIHA